MLTRRTISIRMCWNVRLRSIDWFRIKNIISVLPCVARLGDTINKQQQQKTKQTRRGLASLIIHSLSRFGNDEYRSRWRTPCRVGHTRTRRALFEGVLSQSFNSFRTCRYKVCALYKNYKSPGCGWGGIGTYRSYVPQAWVPSFAAQLRESAFTNIASWICVWFLFSFIFNNKKSTSVQRVFVALCWAREHIGSVDLLKMGTNTCIE